MKNFKGSLALFLVLLLLVALFPAGAFAAGRELVSNSVHIRSFRSRIIVVGDDLDDAFLSEGDDLLGEDDLLEEEDDLLNEEDLLVEEDEDRSSEDDLLDDEFLSEGDDTLLLTEDDEADLPEENDEDLLPEEFDPYLAYEEYLTLYTCKPQVLGSSDVRVGVRCEPVEKRFYKQAE